MTSCDLLQAPPDILSMELNCDVNSNDEKETEIEDKRYAMFNTIYVYQVIFVRFYKGT